jgi:Fe-S cluster biosynthesis and repair protein YggX
MATVMCAKYGKEMPALEKQPFPGEAGKRVLEEVSAKAWDEWLGIQTMIINENRLNMMDPDARKFLSEQRDKFLFDGEEVDLPDDFVDPSIPRLT